MSLRQMLVLTVTFGLLFGCSMTSNSQPELIDWFTDHDTALSEARSLDKPVLIDFYADWCGWCKKMTADTYGNQRVADLAKKFVCLKINSDENAKLAKQYNVQGLPTTVFLKPDGTLLAVIPGYQPPEEFLSKMDKILQSL